MICINCNPPKRPSGFTLVEMLVVLAIVGLLASMVLVAMTGAQEGARVERTRSQVKRIHYLIAQKWEEFETTRVSSRIGISNPAQQARFRVDALRELMRMTLPDRKSDLVGPPYLRGANPNSKAFGGLTTVPAQWRAYRRKAEQLVYEHTQGKANWEQEGGWTTAFENAECLYLILSQLSDDDTTALEFFREDEIGDIDNDGVPEIHDAWGMPIMFLRWAPGFRAVGGIQDGAPDPNDPSMPPNPALGFDEHYTADPFDPMGLYAQFPKGAPASVNHRTFALFPLVISAGPDRKYDIRTDAEGFQISAYAPRLGGPPNNPFLFTYDYAEPGQSPIGSYRDDDPNNGKDDSGDNIHNHVISTGR